MKKSLENQQVVRRNDINVVAVMLACIVGAVVGMVVLQHVRTHGATNLGQPAILLRQTDCRFCHMPPVAKNLKEYDKQRKRVAVRRPDLRELTK
jgi:hypothetical protein